MKLLFILGYRLRNFLIEAMQTRDDPSPRVLYRQTKQLGVSLTFVSSEHIRGRYVRIRKFHFLYKEDVLSLCEVEVFATNAGTLNLIRVLLICLKRIWDLFC